MASGICGLRAHFRRIHSPRSGAAYTRSAHCRCCHSPNQQGGSHISPNRDVIYSPLVLRTGTSPAGRSSAGSGRPETWRAQTCGIMERDKAEADSNATDTKWQAGFRQQSEDALARHNQRARIGTRYNSGAFSILPGQFEEVALQWRSGLNPQRATGVCPHRHGRRNSCWRRPGPEEALRAGSG